VSLSMLLRLAFDPENVQRLGFVRRCRPFKLAPRSATPFLPKYGPETRSGQSAHIVRILREKLVLF